jgi:hypothetical protein
MGFMGYSKITSDFDFRLFKYLTNHIKIERDLKMKRDLDFSSVCLNGDVIPLKHI